MIQVSANDGSFPYAGALEPRRLPGWQLAARVTDKDLAWRLFGKSYERNSSTIQPKKVGMFWKAFSKVQKALMDGRYVAAKNFQIKEKKFQEQHFACT